MIKPMLASDADEAKIKFPCNIQPKIDGVRALNLEGFLTGRSLKKHRNTHTTNLFSRPEFLGFDGEMILGSNPVTDTLCSDTSSALSTIEGTPEITWYLFDYITDLTISLGYRKREFFLTQRYDQLIRSVGGQGSWLSQHIKLVPSYECQNLEQLLEQEEKWLQAGYEGLIIRDINGAYKQGRSTVREGGLLRIKRFVEEEAVVVGLTEGESNENEAQQNELGQTFRTSHAENKVPNGMVGSLECQLVKDVFDPVTKKLLFSKGMIITVAPGKMSHEQRVKYWQDQDLIINRLTKFKFFPKGIKDKPRFPTFQSFKIGSDV